MQAPGTSDTVRKVRPDVMAVLLTTVIGSEGERIYLGIQCGIGVTQMAHTMYTPKRAPGVTCRHKVL
ncbi:hypothetical protein RCH17_003587 [Arthrobacter sp. MP_M7]|nr:hypothetical protein [Arthrobacter sp. MP_M4]MEC5204755.1 hypothetical protein [Arthrobacter sp. MP_M7]